MVEERKATGSGLLIGLFFGIIFDNIALGLIVGLLAGAAVDHGRKSNADDGEEAEEADIQETD